MKTKFLIQILFIAAVVTGSLSCKKEEPPLCGGTNSTVTTIKVVATGLNSPRGLKFGPDGFLYVAEAGIGGSESSMTCAQVVSPVGPYRGSPTGSRISRISPLGVRTTYIDNLPSTTNSVGGIEGVADISFIGNTLYALLNGAGCSHGVPSIPNGIIKVNENNTWTMVANLSEFMVNYPVQYPNAGDFEPDGNWYSMINVGSTLFALEPNSGELVKVNQNGIVSRLKDLSQGHIVPTALVFHHDNFYVGNLGTNPTVPHSSNVYKITQNGESSIFASGFENILGVVFDQLNRMYVLEMTTNNPFPTPGTADIVRVDPSGVRQVVASGLSFPTAMSFGPDGLLYVSNWGFGQPAGGGQILQISFKCEAVQGEPSK